MQRVRLKRKISQKKSEDIIYKIKKMSQTVDKVYKNSIKFVKLYYQLLFKYDIMKKILKNTVKENELMVAVKK